MWKNSVEPDRSQVMRMRISFWIPKAKDAHSEYITLTGFSLQQWLHKRASLLRSLTLAAGVVRADTNKICFMRMFMIREGITPRLWPGRSRA